MTMELVRALTGTAHPSTPRKSAARRTVCAWKRVIASESPTASRRRAWASTWSPPGLSAGV